MFDIVFPDDKITAMLKNISSGRSSLYTILIATLFTVLPGALFSNTPGIIVTSKQVDAFSLTRPDVHITLPDDVMITMRVAKYFAEHGITAYNVGDLAQAATSYVLPIFAAPLFMILNDNIALLVLSLLGAASMGIIAALLVKRQPNLVGWALAIAFALNTSSLWYMYSAWEHLFEALIVVSIYIIAERAESPRRFVLIGALSALAVLMRVDAVFLVVPILLSLLFDKRTRSHAVFAVISFALIGIAYALLQLSWFGWLTPTTARLKAGALPPLTFAVERWLSAIKMGSATLVIPVLMGAFALQIHKSHLLAKAALFGVCLNYIFAFTISDNFLAGRMYIAPLALTAVVLSGLEWRLTAMPKLLGLVQVAFVGGVILSLYLTAQIFGFDPLRPQLETPLSTPATQLAQQAVIADYIGSHFQPTDGSIGLFFLGQASFELDQFRVADFLGKADEAIARGPVKYGPPGHNKWDIDASLKKWKPAAIPLQEIFALASQAELKKQVRDKVDFAFWRELAANSKIRKGYVFCKPYPTIDWGLYVRLDLWHRVSDSCQRLSL